MFNMSSNPKQLYSLYLDGYILSTLSRSGLMLYNILERRGYLFPVEREQTYDLLEQLVSPLNGYSVIIDKHKNELPEDLNRIINYLHDNFWGDYIELRNNIKPFTFVPITNLDPIHPKVSDIAEITIAINSLPAVTSYPVQNQIPFLYTDKEYHEIDIDDVTSFINALPRSIHLNIIGGSLLRYSKLPELFGCLAKHGSYIIFSLTELQDGKENVVRLCFTALINDTELLSENNFDRLNDLRSSDIFIVSNSDEFDCVDLLDEDNIKICPYLSEYSDEKFKESLAIKNEDLLRRKLNKQCFFLNQLINLSCWGKLFISPEGLVFDRYGGKFIGNIHQNLYALSDSIGLDTCWFYTREKSCPECPLKNICVPVSSYEMELDLCPLCDRNINYKNHIL